MVLLTKTYSTAHIPLHCRSREAKRIYCYYDKDCAYKMFGYRLKFERSKS